jgi:hypothetical protein
MESKSAIFVAVGSLLVMAIFSSITNFVSAETTTECYGGLNDGVYLCVHNRDGEISIMMCTDKGGSDGWNCEMLRPKAIPAGIDQAIANTINEVGPSNPNDSKDLGGMQTDKGITKSPIE